MIGLLNFVGYNTLKLTAFGLIAFVGFTRILFEICAHYLGQEIE